MRYTGYIKSDSSLDLYRRKIRRRMCGRETLMIADRMVGKILASITGNKEIDMAKETEIEKKISKVCREK